MEYINQKCLLKHTQFTFSPKKYTLDNVGMFDTDFINMPIHGGTKFIISKVQAVVFIVTGVTGSYVL